MTAEKSSIRSFPSEEMVSGNKRGLVMPGSPVEAVGVQLCIGSLSVRFDTRSKILQRIFDLRTKFHRVRLSPNIQIV